MRISACLATILASALFLNTVIVFAFETDQYNLPPTQLVDIGDEVTQYVRENLLLALSDVNREITKHIACVDKTERAADDCRSAAEEETLLEHLRSDDAVAEAVNERLGAGNLFITVTGKWFRKHKFEHTPDKYKVDYTDSLYILMPIDYATLSPTVHLYGTEFGTDKVEHFFQQGYDYYKLYKQSVSAGKSLKEAQKRAVEWGKRTERTYFGLLVSGVYSNADLYANYAGMKFYQGLARPIKIGSVERPATFILRDGLWSIDEPAMQDEILIKPFIDDRLNEAFNPSGYSFVLYPTVKRVVRRECPTWQKAYPELTHDSAAKLSKDLELWNGEDYGFAKKGHSVAIASCFDGKKIEK